jgi:hypothetical protein
VSPTQTLKALRVTGDPVDYPERSRAGGDITEQRLLVTNRAEVSQTVAAGEHHRKITNHTAQVVAGAPLLQPRQLPRERPCQPRPISDPGQQRATSVRDQTLSVQRDIYLDLEPIACHLHGDPPKLDSKVSTTPRIPAQADSSAAPTTGAATA